MTKAKATKLDKKIQEGLYDLKKPATIYIITDAKGNKKKVGYAEWLKWMKEQKQLYDPKPIYKIGDKVYSYQNPDEPAEIIRVIPSTEKGYAHKYILRIKTKTGSHNSKWINEESLSSRHYDPKLSSLPPTRWYEAMVKGIKKSSDVRNPYAIVKSIWAKLSPSKRSEIKAREAKGEQFKYDLPLPVDKPTRGTGTVRMVKPFKLAEVQVNMSVKDYLVARASGLFQKMKRQDGTTALVARCKSNRPKERNVNMFIDKVGGK